MTTMVQPVLKLHTLSKQYGTTQALGNINAQAGRGEVIGLLGKNGAGKSTLMETLLGFAPPTYGEALVWGESSLRLSAQNKARIGYVPQQDELLPNLSARGWLELIARFHARWDRELEQRLLMEWELPPDKRIAKLSVGQKQKLAIISALCHHPQLLVLDEPVASLDPIARRQFLQEIIAIAAQGEATILFSTHIVSDLERIANRIWMLQAGSLVFDGELDALKEGSVRLHRNNGEEALPAGAQLLHRRKSAQGCVQSVAQWRDEFDPWAQQQGITIERMGLEDIFMEMHA